MNELVLIRNNEILTDSLIIAEGTQNEHKSIKRLIQKYTNHFMSLNTFPISNRESETLSISNRQSTGGRPEEYYELNEPQATFLMTLLRNSEIVVAFKLKLVQQFYQMRMVLQSGNLPAQLPPQPPPTDALLDRMDKLLNQHDRILTVLESKATPVEISVADVLSGTGGIEAPPTESLYLPKPQESEYRKQLETKKSLTVFEAAAHTGIGQSVLRKIIKREDFTAKVNKNGGRILIDRVGLDDWLARQSTPPPAAKNEPEHDMTKLKVKKMLTKKEACFYIGISIQTLNRLMAKTDFYPVSRIGLGRGRVFVNREKLDQWLNEQDGDLKNFKQ